MKIDFHCHTKSVKQGDGDGRNVSVELFKTKIADADVKIVAITNHNLFDLKQYEEFKTAVKDFCQVWPGIEIDILGKNNKYHLIIVCNPDNVNEFDKRVKTLFNGKNLNTVNLDIESVYNTLNDCDIIYIPHFHKNPGISEEDIVALEDLVIDKYRIFGETSNNKSLGVFTNHDYRVIIGSDVRDWSNYEKSTFAELKLQVESFNQFCLLAKRDKVVVDTLLNKKHSYSVTAHPHKTVSIPLVVFGDVNIIFGQKGTGKSEILNSLFEELTSQGIGCSRYTGSQKEEEFKTLLKVNGVERGALTVGAEECKDEFEAIEQWSEAIPTTFSTYLDWYKTKDNNANKSRMKITDSTTLLEVEPDKYSKHSQDNRLANELIERLDKIDSKEYLEDEENYLLNELVKKLKYNISRLLTEDIIDIKSTELTNYSIDKIKSIADKNSDSVSKPSSTGFFEYAKNRIEIKRCVEKILKNITNKSSYELERLGELEDKGTINIQLLYRMLADDSRTDEFELGIKTLKEIKSKLELVNSNIWNEDLPIKVEELSCLCRENKVDSTKHFLGLSKRIVTSDNNPYLPSNGEKGILLLQKLLNEEKDAYFLDEPELGMGNSYIDSIIRPQISALAKKHKTVIIATHNANIAVRTLPYMSVFRTYQNGKYYTYIGNPFNDKLINVDDQNDVKSWTKESLHTLEGGEEAFYERKSIYESNN